MINLNEPRRPKRKEIGARFWLFVGTAICLTSLFDFFVDKDIDAFASVSYGLYVICVYLATKKGSAVLRRGLVIAGFLALVFAWSLFGPHLEMHASQARISTQRGNVVAQSRYIIRIFDVSIESKHFAQDDVDSYKFTLEADGYRYRDQTSFWVARRDRILDQSCLKKSPIIASNALVTCQVAFEIPASVKSGKLVYNGDYKTRADISF